MSRKKRSEAARILAAQYVSEGNPHKPGALRVASSAETEGGVHVELRVIVVIPDRLLPAPSNRTRRVPAPAPAIRCETCAQEGCGWPTCGCYCHKAGK